MCYRKRYQQEYYSVFCLLTILTIIGQFESLTILVSCSLINCFFYSNIQLNYSLDTKRKCFSNFISTCIFNSILRLLNLIICSLHQLRFAFRKDNLYLAISMNTVNNQSHFTIPLCGVGTQPLYHTTVCEHSVLCRGYCTNVSF